jgi:hypothetical protein
MAYNNDWLHRNHEDLYNQANVTARYLTGEILTRFGMTGTIDFAMRWKNTVGQKDLWNAIISAIIP